MRIQAIFWIACGLFALAGFGCFTQWRDFSKHAVRTTARFEGYLPSTGARAVRLVTFTTPDGVEHKQRASNSPRWADAVRVGETVEILYTVRQVFGVPAWNVMMVRPGETGNPQVIALVGAVVFWLLALGALLVSLVI